VSVVDRHHRQQYLSVKICELLCVSVPNFYIIIGEMLGGGRLQGNTTSCSLYSVCVEEVRPRDFEIRYWNTAIIIIGPSVLLPTQTHSSFLCSLY
jgi:hypothetical protein